jgi:hypothetical protein
LGGGAVVVGGAGPRQGFQGGQQGLAGLGVQQPVDGDHAVQGRRQPQPPAVVAPQRLLVGGIRVGDLAEVTDDLAQPGWVQPPRGLQQHRFGGGGGRWGEGLGGAGQRRRVEVAEIAVGEGLGGPTEGAAVQGSGDADALVGVGVTHAGAVAQPAGGGLGGGAVVGAGGAAAVHARQFAQPVAFQPVQQPAQQQHPPGGLRVGQSGQVFGGQLVHCGGQQPDSSGQLHRMCVRIHGGNLSHPPSDTSSNREIVDNFSLERVLRDPGDRGADCQAGIGCRVLRQPPW